MAAMHDQPEILSHVCHVSGHHDGAEITALRVLCKRWRVPRTLAKNVTATVFENLTKAALVEDGTQC
jgi:hypothetical protein